MCIQAVEGVKSKGNKAISNFAFNQSVAAQDRAIMYEQKKKELIVSGVPEPKAIKMAEQYIRDVAGASANAGGKTNNDKEAFVDKSKQQNERILGETNVKGELKTLIDSSSDADNSNDNMAGDQKRPASFDNTDISTNTHAVEFSKSFNSFSQKMVAKMLNKFGVTLTGDIKKAIESLSDNELDNLASKMRKMNANDVMKEIKSLGT
jgi:hypothetical protein